MKFLHSIPKERYHFVFVLLFFWFLILYASHILMPLWISLVVAYILQTPLQWMKQRWRCSHVMATWCVFSFFLSIFIFFFVACLPPLAHQISDFFKEVPSIAGRAHTWFQQFVLYLKNQLPLNAEQINPFLLDVQSSLMMHAKGSIKVLWSHVPGMIEILIYMIIVPIFVYFLLMDQAWLMSQWVRFLPKERTMLTVFWRDLSHDIGGYIRGKCIQILVLSTTCYLFFYFMKLPYALLLSFLCGVSELIPYVGAVISAIPTLIVALVSFGIGSHLMYFSIGFFLIFLIDAHLFVPLLFGGILNLHPFFILLSVMVFGEWFGFWGVFFAMPLASLIKIVLKIWPSHAGVAQKAEQLIRNQ